MGKKRASERSRPGKPASTPLTRTGAGVTAADDTERLIEQIQREAARFRPPPGGEKSNEELMAAYQEQLKLTEMMFRESRVYTAADIGQGTVKPRDQFPVPSPIGQCRPINLSEMRAGTTHKGRVLFATVAIAQPIVRRGTIVLLRDSEGKLVNTIIYNFLPAPKGATLQQLHDMARELLPKGTRLGIIDPFYKVMMDGTTGIRVDNPREVVYLTEAQTADAVSTEYNDQMAAAQAAGAQQAQQDAQHAQQQGDGAGSSSQAASAPAAPTRDASVPETTYERVGKKGVKITTGEFSSYLELA